MAVVPKKKEGGGRSEPRVQSITEVVLIWGRRPVGKVTVYRRHDKEPDQGMFELENQDILEVIAKIHPTYYVQLANELVDLPGVVKVEVRNASNDGILFYAE